MQRLLPFIICLICFQASAQWVNLGDQPEMVYMLYDGIGYKNEVTSYGGGSYRNTIYGTHDDWNSEFQISTWLNGGSTIWNINDWHILNDSVMFFHEDGYNWDYFKSNDGGNSHSVWNQTAGYHIDMYLINDTIGYFTSWPSRISLISDNSTQDLFSYGDTLLISPQCELEFINIDTGFVALHNTQNGSSELWRTSDMGSTWTTVLSQSTGEFSSISFPAPNTGYATTLDGKIYKSFDSGTNWTMIASPTILAINDCDFFNEGLGYIVCDSGKIFKTIDGGDIWTEELSGVIEDIARVDIINLNTVYAYCEGFIGDGSVLKNESQLSIDQNELQINIILQPNPVSEVINIEIDNSENIELVEIYNMSGQRMLTSEHKQIDCSVLENGFYLVQIKTDKRFEQLSMIKQ